VANPTDALALAQLREATGSNKALLQVGDPTQPAQRIVEGRPLLVSPYVAIGDVWGIPAERVLLVVRDDADVVAGASPFFTSDRTAVRATRVGFGFPDAAAIVRIRRAAAVDRLRRVQVRMEPGWSVAVGDAVVGSGQVAVVEPDRARELVERGVARVVRPCRGGIDPASNVTSAA
jgi:hypothetical protein